MSKPERSSTYSKKTQAGLRVLLRSDEIRERVGELARQISEDHRSSDLLIIGVLKGAFVFLSDLIREMTIPAEIDFVRLASYGPRTIPEPVRVILDMVTPVTGRDVLIVEDIVDTGYSVEFLVDMLTEQGARSVKVCALLDKPSRRVVDVGLDYVGFTISDVFVVGYGIDFAEQHRNLPDVCIVETERPGQTSRPPGHPIT